MANGAAVTQENSTMNHNAQIVEWLQLATKATKAGDYDKARLRTTEALDLLATLNQQAQAGGALADVPRSPCPPKPLPETWYNQSGKALYYGDG